MTEQDVRLRRCQEDFNSHAHVERDSWTYRGWDDESYFNSHAHVERDKKWLFRLLFRYYFNSHAHVERDKEWNTEKKDISDFNSHAHVERDRHWKGYKRDFANFNSHAHVERDLYSIWGWQMPKIFQLTRSRGAWLLIFSIFSLFSIFQLTRSRGAWPSCNVRYWRYNRFQLTRSRGAWQVVYLYDEWTFCISTHTLTWSVTACNFEDGKKSFNFNSHAHVERDPTEFVIANPILGFQLTRSRGAWRQRKTIYSKYVTFQLTRSRGAWLQGVCQ